MKQIYLVFSALLCVVSSAFGSPLETGPFADSMFWELPGGERGTLVKEDSPAVLELRVPELSEKEKSLPEDWRGVVSLDCFGTLDGVSNEVILEAFVPASGDVFATVQGFIEMPAPRANWMVISSSEHGQGNAMSVVDGDPESDWHSRYGKNLAKPPHWIGIAFGKPHAIEGVRYLPRQGGAANGVAKDYRLEIRRPNGDWEMAKKGRSDRSIARDRKAMELRFDQKEVVTGFRFVVESDWSGGGFGTAAELSPIGLDLPPQDEASPAAKRLWLEVAAPLMEKFSGRGFGLRVRVEGTGVVMGTSQFCRVHGKPTKKLMGKANGHMGPDKLGAGLLGFEALSEHRQAVLSLMKVRNGSPAAKAGLTSGDVIVSVAGKALPMNDLAPGWNWFNHSHEAVLGRETESVLQGGSKVLTLGILREGEVVDVELQLPRKQAFTSMNPANDAQAAELLENLIAWLVEHQREDGSWSGGAIRTCFSSLALLATGEKKHEERVRKAIEWSLAKYPEPEKYGNLGFWHGGYTGLLYAEWYLRTGDQRVLPHLEKLRDWAIAGQHMSKWNVPALGHGPSGLPYSNKSLVAPSCHLLVFEAVAKRCGMESQIWELLTPYMVMSWSDPEEGGNGSLGYNRSYKDEAEFWGRSGLFVMACQLRNERPDMRDAMTSFMYQRHPWIRNSHAYGEPGGAWGLLALHLAAPEKFREVIEEYRWWFSLAWEPGEGLQFTTPHMGAPYMGEDDLINAAYALVLQAEKRTLHITGKKD